MWGRDNECCCRYKLQGWRCIDVGFPRKSATASRYSVLLSLFIIFVKHAWQIPRLDEKGVARKGSEGNTSELVNDTRPPPLARCPLKVARSLCGHLGNGMERSSTSLSPFTLLPLSYGFLFSQQEDPTLVRKFVHEVGARGLEQQLRGAQEEVTRAMMPL